MLNIKKNSISKPITVKSVLSSLEPPDADSVVKSKKFSLVPFARGKSSMQDSNSNSNPVEIKESIDGNRVNLVNKPTKPADAAVSDGDDDYEDDNDFEPFETSKKDFYTGDSQTHRTESDSGPKSAFEPHER